MSSSKKRGRKDADDTRADCPFTAYIVDPKDKEQINKKRRKSATSKTADESDVSRKTLVQLSPFSPTGKFRTHETMDVPYAVDHPKKWAEMTRYNSFVLNNVKYFSEGFIFVANEQSIERQKAMAGRQPQTPMQRSDEDWVARILEIRASDEHHVYARVYWMYWPEELPEHTMDGKRYPRGRQPYHGRSELVASNHMDVINVVSVTCQAQVNQMIENDDDETQGALYWRQALDVRTNEISTVEPICYCGQPANPDKVLIGCTKEECGKWLHDECLIHDALLRAWERLGADKPQLKSKDETEESKRPLSPKEPGAEASAQQSIDVKPDRSGDADSSDKIDVAGIKTEPLAKASEEPSSKAVTPTPSSRASTSTPKPTRSARKGSRVKRKVDKPYEGLFEAKTYMDGGPPVIEITDLRPGVKGGLEMWQEYMHCLVCRKQIL